ncbi:MAG TPA: acyltransferase family protein [Mycobacteriales bacterium]|nr:acyltransferase family protein [Mycobacteriales bacterium]
MVRDELSKVGTVNDGVRSASHWSGLDGLRAIAVIAVVVYHFAPFALPGGFLGVDIFFVISGYLITRLLAQEFLAVGSIDVARFYRRRARRLLPALAVVLSSVSVAALVWRDQLATVRGGVLAASVFGANWWLAFDHQSYFVATGRPSMLQHLWSLGVEEQFYLFWPVIAAALLAGGRRSIARHGWSRRRAVGRICVVAVLIAFASTGLMWWLADLHDVPYGNDGSLLYYGTDTHCMGLLLGAALGAWAAAGGRLGADRTQRWRWWLGQAAGALALAGVGVLLWRVAEYSHSLYRGDFLLVSVLVAMVVAVATQPDSALGKALDAPLLRWIGVRSYSIYLWHWPIAVVTRPGIDTTMPTWLDQLLRVGLTIALADATYRWIETPVRRLGFVAVAARAREAVRTRWRDVPPRPGVAGPVALAVLLGFAALVIVVGPAAPNPPAAVGAGVGGRDLSLSGSVAASHHSSAPGPGSSHHPRSDGRSGARRATALPKLSGFGDSVLLGARSALSKIFPGGSIDAVVGRQPDPILADVRAAAKAGKLQPYVVLHLGNNGLIKPADLVRTLQDLSGARLVLVLNDHLDPYDHAWQKPNNATIARIVPRYANARVLDWNAIAGRHHDWLYPDDLHLRPAGATAYARLLAQAYRHDVRPGS